MLEIRETDVGVSIRLRVAPGASKAEIKGVHAGALKLSITEPPEKGKANKGVIRLLAKSLNLAAKNLEITSGHTSQDKAILICGVDAQTFEQLLTEHIDD
ncbi:DUF167 domain-containing protein [Planctomycetota bacterium]|nr:DUF167 domain-containing protein [Planctomycetota bacterium]